MPQRSLLARVIVSEYSLTVFLVSFTIFCLTLLANMALRAGFGVFFTSVICTFALPLFVGNGLSLFLTITSGILCWLCVPRHVQRRGKRRRPQVTSRRPGVAILVFSHEEDDPLGNLRRIVNNMIGGFDGSGKDVYSKLLSTCQLTLFLLSDSKTPDQLREERDAINTLRAEFPGWAFEYEQRTAGGYEKYGNLCDNFLKRYSAEQYPYYFALDWDSAVTGNCLLRLFDELAPRRDLAAVQATISIHRPMATTRFATLCWWSQQFTVMQSFKSCLSGQWGHNVLVSTHVAQELIKAYPAQSFPQESLKSHDWWESMMMSVLGYSTAIIDLPEDSQEGLPLTVGENVRRSIRWAFGSDRWPPVLFQHFWRAEWAVQLFGWLAILNFINQILVTILTFVVVFGHGTMKYLLSATAYENFSGQADTWLAIRHPEPVILLGLVIGSLFLDRFLALLHAMIRLRADSAMDYVKLVAAFVVTLVGVFALAPMQSVVLAYAQLADLAKGTGLAWKPPEREAGERRPFVHYVCEYGLLSVVGLGLLLGIHTFMEMSLLALWPGAFAIALLICPWTCWYLDREVSRQVEVKSAL